MIHLAFKLAKKASNLAYPIHCILMVVYVFHPYKYIGYWIIFYFSLSLFIDIICSMFPKIRQTLDDLIL